MVGVRINYCPFCGNELTTFDELCPFCDRNISLLSSGEILERKAGNVILNCLVEMPREFGRYVLSKVLKGSASREIFENDLDYNPCYGDLGKIRKKDIVDMIDQLIENGFIDTEVKGEEIAVVRLSNRGKIALEGKDVAWVSLPFELSRKFEPIFAPHQKAVITEVRSMRKNLAVANDVPPYLIFDDQTLKDIALKLPTTVEELLKVKGIKEVKARKYAEEILETIKWTLEDFEEEEADDEDIEGDIAVRLREGEEEGEGGDTDIDESGGDLEGEEDFDEGLGEDVDIDEGGGDPAGHQPSEEKGFDISVEEEAMEESGMDVLKKLEKPDATGEGEREVRTLGGDTLPKESNAEEEGEDEGPEDEGAFLERKDVLDDGDEERETEKEIE